MSAAGLEALRDRIAGHLREQTGGAVDVTDVRPLLGGACQDNFQVKLVLGEGELRGEQRLVLRHDAPSSLDGSLRRDAEYAVIRAAHEAGVRTPAARWLGRDLVGEGFGYFLEWAPGVAIGRRVVRNPELADARAALPRQLAIQLARIHRITPSTHPDLPISALGATFDGDPTRSALAGLRWLLDELAEPHAAMELALAWLEEHRPTGAEATLVHGDFRTGNFLVTRQGLSAVLDWEFAHWGSPAEDIAWLCVRDWRFGMLTRPVGGFAERSTFYAAYEAESGRTVDPVEVHWWEVCGNLRWAAGAAQQGERYLSGKQTDIELIAIARRCAEMEYEALRLIQEYPIEGGR